MMNFIVKMMQLQCVYVYAYLLFITHRHSIAEPGGCFQRRLFY